jgi:transcriptional regulator with XRE-family HTH domain
MDVKSSGAVSHYFTSRNEPTVKQLNNLAKLLKVKPQYLLYGDNSLNSKLITQCSSIVRDLNIQNEMGLSEEQQVQLVIYVYNQSLKENRVEMLSEEQIIDTANLLLAV